MIITVLNYKLDFLIFTVVSLGGMTAIHLWLRRVKETTGVSKVTWALLIVLILIGGWFAERAGERTKNELRNMLEGFAPTYAEELEHMGHSRLRLDTPPDDPLYLSLIEAEIRWLKVNKEVNDIYTFRKREDGKVVLLVDSETDYDRNGKYEDEKEKRTPIGEIYTEVDLKLEEAFAGKPGFFDIPVTDRWGTWVSAYYPMHDEKGIVEAVLGVDYSASEWNRAVLWDRDAALGFFAILVVLLIANSSILSIIHAGEEKREKLIHELQEALAKVRTLHGLLPICAACKKIRDDKGYWNQIEFYIKDHSEAEFSHGICPECSKKLYPTLG